MMASAEYVELVFTDLARLGVHLPNWRGLPAHGGGSLSLHRAHLGVQIGLKGDWYGYGGDDSITRRATGDGNGCRHDPKEVPWMSVLWQR